MRKDLSRLHEQNKDKFDNVDYLHGYRYGLLVGEQIGYEKAIDDCNKIIENAFDSNIIDSIAYACITANFEHKRQVESNDR